MIVQQGRRVLDIEARALKTLADSLDDAFERVARAIVDTEGRVILTGIGKSGIVCRKIAATLASTGTPAFFLHSAEAIHGDLGMITRGDLVIGVSNSGETEELVRLLEHIKRLGARLVAITGAGESTLARYADLALVYRVEEEGCPLGLAPMASTTVTLALGDALAAAVMDARGFTTRQFAAYHPGGKLGKRLMLVVEGMGKHQGRPLVQADASLNEALVEMSEKRLGVTAVALEDGSLGLISDGDIRRTLQRHGDAAFGKTAGEVCTRDPKTIRVDQLAVEALQLMEDHHITALIALDEAGGYAGVVHLHDLWKTQMV